ncbi:MAG: hypothetical protein ACQKBY_03930 [Verrucomicrobiales bacterium]
MKKLMFSLLVMGLSVAAQAAGVAGKITNSSGSGRSGVTVLIRLENQKIQTTSNKEGIFVIECPPSASGTKSRVYVNGKYVTTVTIPVDGYAQVNVNYEK